MAADKREFGTTSDGTQTFLYTMRNKNGMEVSVTDYGASLVRAAVPAGDARLVDVVLGYDSASGYENGGGALGATVGRNANRIAGASFTLNGKTYTLDKNEGENNLHSGYNPYHKRMWEVETSREDQVSFYLHSPSMDQGFPGDLLVRVTYELDDDNGLFIHYKAVAEKDTIVNMTNHSYFNLNGHKSGSVLRHELQLESSLYTPADSSLLPTGEIRFVEGTKMDFTKKRAIQYEYDDNFILQNNRVFGKIAEVTGDSTGITMEVYTDLPAVQIYTGNFLAGEKGKDGAVYGKNAGLCMETQFIPNAIGLNGVEKPIVRGKETFRTSTLFRFR